MTNAIVSTTVTTGSGAAGSILTGAGKPGSTSGFAGALEQAVGGTGSNGTAASGMPMQAGLLGLLGLLGSQSPGQTSQPLSELLSGLSKQLEGLDSKTELSSDAQTQLAGLLLLVQSLLTQLGIQPSIGQSGAAADGTSQADSAESLIPATLTAEGQSVVPQLRQSLTQLSALLASGTAMTDQQNLFTQQIRQAIDALTGQSSSVPVSNEQPAEVRQGTATVKDALKPAEQNVTAVQGAAEQAAEASPEIRRTGPALRNPVWQTHMMSAAETPAIEGTATPAAIEPGEAAGQNGSAPAWTFLKGDNVPLTASTQANAQAAPMQVPVQQFAEHIGKYLVKQFVLTQAGGTHEAKILLHPEHLGQVDIKIMIQNGQLSAQIVTENGAARDLLENQLSQLRSALQGQGLQVDRVEVMQQSSASSSSSASFFQQNQRQQGSGQQGNGGSGRGASGIYDDTAGFEAELNRTTSLREVGYGSTLNVRA